MRQLALGALPLLLATTITAEPLTLRRAVERALQQNPGVNHAAAEIEAAEARLNDASGLLRDNPELSVAAGPRYTEEGTQLDLGVQLTQPVEIAGQRGARMEAAEAALLAARARLQNERAEVVARARTSFAAVLAAQARVEVAGAAVSFANRSLDAARDRMTAGAASQIDVNAALVELGRAQREYLGARQRLVVERAHLAALLGLDPREDLEVAGALEPTKGQNAEVASTDEAAIQLALKQRADLAAARAALEAARAESSLANRSALPTPSLGVGYTRETRENVIQGLLSVPIPVFSQGQAERGAANARVRQAEIELGSVERRIMGETRVAVQRLAAAREIVHAYQSQVGEAAQQNVGLVQEGYRAGKLDLFQLLLIQRDALDARRSYIDALEELAAAAAELDRVLGPVPEP